MTFFQLIEKNGERKGVHSPSDLRYMLSRGWQPAVQMTVQKPDPPKKRGRPRKS